MKREKITVANFKFECCSAIIKNKLCVFEGVKNVETYHDRNSIEIEHEGKISREVFTEKLASLGYPEATEENGLLSQLKNYESCNDCSNSKCVYSS